MVLVENIKLHWALDYTGKGDEEWSVFHCIEHIKDMATVLLLSEWSVGIPLGSKDIVIL